MIVAVYKNGNALWATVIPVASIVKFNGYSEQQPRTKKTQNKTDSFAAMLLSAEKALDSKELKGIEYR